MIKQILAIRRDMRIIRKGYVEDFKRILKDYRYIRIMRKKEYKND